MIVGERLRILREAKKLSQGDVQDRTGLMRCYISRVENGHTVPAVETLYKFARALEVPMYRLFYDEEDSPGGGNHPSFAELDSETSRGNRRLSPFLEFLPDISLRNRDLLLGLARKMAGSNKRRLARTPSELAKSQGRRKKVA